MVLGWCSAVSRRSVPVGADQCFSVSPSLDHGLASLRSRPLWALLWISVVASFLLGLAIADLEPTRSQEQDQASVSGECQGRNHLTGGRRAGRVPGPGPAPRWFRSRPGSCRATVVLQRRLFTRQRIVVNGCSHRSVSRFTWSAARSRLRHDALQPRMPDPHPLMPGPTTTSASTPVPYCGSPRRSPSSPKRSDQ